MSKKKVLHLALAFDENYLIPFYVLLTSIFRHNRHHILVIHAIATGIGEDSVTRIERFVTSHHASIHFYKVDQPLIKHFAVSNEARYTMAVYYRLFFPYLIDEAVARIIYLDIDTLVLGDLYDLWNWPLSGYPIAVAPEKFDIRPDLGITEYEKYFNSGVMLIDLQTWRQLSVTPKCIEFLQQFPEKALYHDQDALNVVLIDNWSVLDHKYNYTSLLLPRKWWNDVDYAHILAASNLPTAIRQEQDEVIRNITILHYNYLVKPWAVGANHPLSYLFNSLLLEFAGTSTGQSVITADFIFNISCRIFEFIKNQPNDLETRLILAFSLHWHWINCTHGSSFPDLPFLLDRYYASGNGQSHFETEYQNNRLALDELRSATLQGNCEDEIWRTHWEQICIREISGLENAGREADWTRIPGIINKHLGIGGKTRSLLYYFIYRSRQGIQSQTLL